MRYKLNELIGKGGFGEVYEAEADEGGRKIALKKFALAPTMKGISEIAKKRFIKEAIFQKGLIHPNIVEIYEINTDENPPYFTMRLADDSMHADIINGVLNKDNFIKCMFDIMAGLEEMHNYSMFHRDLKPANVLRFKDNYAIGDFGLMSMNKTGITTLTQTGMAKSSDMYTAPEITQDLKYASVQSDIYSLACILHDFVGVSGRVPCHEISEVSEYGDLLLGATRKDPSRRFSSVSSFREALNSISQDEVSAKTEQGEIILEILKKDVAKIKKKDVVAISDFLSSNVIEDEKDTILSAISIEYIRAFLKYPIPTTFIAKCYFEYVRNRSFIWTYCDTLANRVLQFMKIDSIDILSEGAFALLYMGTSHNRYFVMKKALPLFSGDIEERLLKRMIMEIRVNSKKFCKAHRDLIYALDKSSRDFHTEIQNIVNEMC